MEESVGAPNTPKHIVCKEKEGLFQIILNRPPINAFNVEMVEEINTALASLLYRRDIKVVIFLASGKNFCGGFSPEDFSEDRAYQLIESFGRMFQQLSMLNIPVLSVVQGMALGAGFELVIFSDLAIATESSKFGFPDIRIGLFPALAEHSPAAMHPAQARRRIDPGRRRDHGQGCGKIRAHQYCGPR